MSKEKENQAAVQEEVQETVVTPEQASEAVVEREEKDIQDKNVYHKLLYVQKHCKVPKGQYNSFGKYSYRTTEDIMAAIKPLLWKVGATVLIDDTPVVKETSQGSAMYIEATVKFIDCNTGETISNKSSAKEGLPKGNMSDAQNTGSASTYARKYALNGMFLLDDTKDDDATNNGSYQNNNGYQNSGYDNSGYQNGGYNNGYDNSGYQQNGYQNGYQNGGYNNGYNG